VNGRAFPAVWRDTLSFTVGGLKAVGQFPRIRPDATWNYQPEPASEADIEQAIAAKLHIGLRLLPLLAAAEVVTVEPEMIEAIPEWRSEEHALYAAEAELPVSPLFLDLEALDGRPTSWEAPTWPLPFHLRGALCWNENKVLSVVPVGSVGGSHPWGGTGYQAWARWAYLQGHAAGWPDPGPGDFLVRASGDVRAWVDAEQDSVCTQQGVVTNNLSRRVLSVLMAMEAVGGSLVEPTLHRSIRRRAQREGKRIARVPERFPQLPERRTARRPDPELAPARSETCVVSKTHARLDQAHALWHEALEVYADPDAFVTKLNALIAALRSVTWVLRWEFANSEEFKNWYSAWEQEMHNDERMRWLVSARNAIEKRGDLDTNSVARVRVIGDWLDAPILDLHADPTTGSDEIVRGLEISGLSSRARSEGTLVVERQWTVAELAGDELLDALAHCYGVLDRIIADAHAQRGACFADCVLTSGHACRVQNVQSHPSGRLPCMIATRERRTARRNLATGTLYGVELRPVSRPDIDDEAVRKRYSFDDWEPAPQGAGWFAHVGTFHEMGKQMLAVDGYHLTIAWLYREDQIVAQTVLHPEDQRDKYMMVEGVAAEADRLGADAIAFTTEAWEAGQVAGDDPRTELRPGEREDREELFVTYALRRGADCRIWTSRVSRVDGTVTLGRTEASSEVVPNFLLPIVRMWDGWTDG